MVDVFELVAGLMVSISGVFFNEVFISVFVLLIIVGSTGVGVEVGEFITR